MKKNDKLNLVFIHKSNSWYLYYAIKQAVKSNPNAKIYLIGDSSNRNFKNITHFNIANFYSKASEFSKIYKHLSKTSYDFELFCIQRWFILLEFMEFLFIENAILVDSDVLVFQDINLYLNNIKVNYHHSKGTTNYMGFIHFKRRADLNSVCDFITNQYSDHVSFASLKQIYYNYESEGHYDGISDITLFELYDKKTHCKIIDFETPPVNNMTFINNLGSPFFKLNKNKYVDLI